jgi:hypothetical protein
MIAMEYLLQMKAGRAAGCPLLQDPCGVVMRYAATMQVFSNCPRCGKTFEHPYRTTAVRPLCPACVAASPAPPPAAKPNGKAAD